MLHGLLFTLSKSTNDIIYIISSILLIIYIVSLVMVFFYALAQLNLLFNYLKAKKKDKKGLDNSPKFDLNNPDEIPYVTIQLPVFNEKYVMKRLLKNIALLDYPREKLEIQVLDDSTDETVIKTKERVDKLAATGLDIIHITRTNRQGYKAGALKEGLAIAKGELIAIFDSDFLPEADWLYKTIPYFKDEKIGVVQTRWGHINRNYSLLTKIQAFALDAHFTLEQMGRNSKGHFINFNGTAGVWRKECIYDAGNWEGDTLTEDLDLSYRAQLKGWQFKYLVDVETPAELPVVISAARSQQFRWNKGGAENFQKMFKKIIHSDLSFKTKAHCVLHLLNSTMFLNVLIVGVLSVPMLYVKNYFDDFKGYFIAMSFFGISTLIFFICYWYMFKHVQKKSGVKGFLQYIRTFLTFFSVAMGLSLNNSGAVIEGHRRKRSEFVRTPKFNIKSIDGWKTNKYIRKKPSKNVIYEGFLCLYFLFGIVSAWLVRYIGRNELKVYDKECMFGLAPCDAWYIPFDSGLIIFHVMLFLGFGFIFYTSVFKKV
ncbi:Glycosyltransferase, catalytic subunit of cellulose synthase and poly-beta-1,6-N-acetylglucosamine synthase [Wenyingzhuangia marina]|uniref:Glycosyltransferase, catalytic subunit of cellulose synthase and poly-beta-1,6-N-acetylglucosamine synthase n=2 Tax=Wenyingzhuangia marina TaxID=1195760 RepID=A0A1M5WXB3_9FLAO|nr:cellulose synthase family protein [Wenyingzhuangia marina]SHH91978.1 Glycosyltransferase, catalytic subunit of cellulose synthase and poly-beta-1,6-N-acetylglucosamine synthase [Wenyingzhuangia marina]